MWATAIHTPKSCVVTRTALDTTGCSGAGVNPSRVCGSTPPAGCQSSALCTVMTKLIAVEVLGQGVETKSTLRPEGWTSAKKQFAPGVIWYPLRLSFTFCWILCNLILILKIPFFILKKKILILISIKYTLFLSLTDRDFTYRSYISLSKYHVPLVCKKSVSNW